MNVTMLTILISLLIFGCDPIKNFTIHPPQTAVVQLPVSPDIAMTRAARVAALMGGDIRLVPGQPYMLQAHNVHQAVLLVVEIKPIPTGSEVTINGSINTSHIFIGNFDEVQEFMVQLQKER